MAKAKSITAKELFFNDSVIAGEKERENISALAAVPWPPGVVVGKVNTKCIKHIPKNWILFINTIS